MKKHILTAENVQVSFDGFMALDIDHFHLEENELRVVIGPNGAGKTTFMDILCGKTKASRGTITVDGKNITKMSERRITELGVGRKFQTPSVFTSLTVYDNMYLAIKTHKTVFNTLFATQNRAITEKIEYIASRTGLENELHRIAGSLSHGQKQWLEIAIVLLQEPRILLIDEPAAGMTDAETEKTGEMLKELSANHSIIVIEHDMEFVRQIARTVTVLAEGKRLVEGPMDVIQNDERVIERYLGKRSKGQKTTTQISSLATA